MKTFLRTAIKLFVLISTFVCTFAITRKRINDAYWEGFNEGLGWDHVAGKRL